jgi:hypothetical protein
LRRQHALTPHRSFHARPISAACLCACVVLLDTGGALLSLCLSVEFTYPPSCLPSLGAALLPALLAAFLRCGTMKALTPAPVHPKCRSPRLLRYTFLSFRLQPRRGCLIIAYHHASVTSVFRTSPWNRRLVAAPPPNRVRLPTDRQFASGCSPRRFEPTQLPSATELWHTPTRTFTVLMWRHHGRTIPDRSIRE